MRYFRTKTKTTKDIKSLLTELDSCILNKLNGRSDDIFGVISTCKPYPTKVGKKFATTEQVLSSIGKLVKLKLVEER